MFSTDLNSLKCPACRNENIKVVDHFKYRDFDGSLFNIEADLGACGGCGFVRVGVPFDDEQISVHYACHSLYNSLGGVGVGGSTAEDIVRYRQYLSILDGIEERSESIADIGCSNGGFLKYLRDNSRRGKKLTGIDVDMRALSSLEGIDAVQGNARNLNLADDSLDLAFYTHVIEHILDIDGVLSEMTRVVSKDGHVLIEVPDATGYSESRVHDFYWIGMKEHVNHFTPKSLCCALHRHGIEVRRVARSKFPVRGGVYYPSLIVLAKVVKKKELEPWAMESGDPSWLPQHMSREREFAAKTRHNLEAFLSHAGKPVVWGIGLEYFNLLALDVLPVDYAAMLVDSNLAKQSQTVSGSPVLAPSLAPLGKPLICMAPLSWLPIVEQACALGFDKKEIFCI